LAKKSLLNLTPGHFFSSEHHCEPIGGSGDDDAKKNRLRLKTSNRKQWKWWSISFTLTNFRKNPNVIWCQFHQHFKGRSQQHKKTVKSSVSFCAFGIFMLLVKRWWNRSLKSISSTLNVQICHTNVTFWQLFLVICM